MKSPTIQFRLTPYQLACGLQAIRNLEPSYKPTSINALVKLIFIDYCSKMAIGPKAAPHPQIVNEITSMLKPKDIKEPTIDDIIKSKKSVVTDFSPIK